MPVSTVAPWLLLMLPTGGRVRGSVPLYGWLVATVFASYVVLDVIAIPFSSLLGSAGE